MGVNLFSYLCGKMKTLLILLMLPILLSACHSKPAATPERDTLADVVQAAEQGDAKAQMRMGIIYDNGLEGRLQNHTLTKSILYQRCKGMHNLDLHVIVYKNTFKRNHEGYFHCTEQQVKAMIRDSYEGGNDGAPAKRVNG